MTNILATIVLSLVTNQSTLLEQSSIQFGWNGQSYSLPFHNRTVRKRVAPQMPPLPPGFNPARFVPQSVIPVTKPVGTLQIAVTNGLNILWCDTNSSGCVLYDQTRVSEVQKTGYQMEIQVADSVIQTQRTVVAYFAAGPTIRTNGFDWFRPDYLRKNQEYFVAVQMIPPTTGRVKVRSDFVNPLLAGVKAFSYPQINNQPHQWLTNSFGSNSIWYIR